MSTTHISAALDVRADIAPTERLLLVLLARDAADDGATAPSIDRLARAANVHPSTVTRSLRRLADTGLIQRARGFTTSGSSWAWRVNLQTADNSDKGPQA
ncbi:helix-turn-helix domain-containing protein [Streptomyces sp. NPDC058762]|uniref:helix-turn-helix domain-containing protein n=1 Tax=Streptomyces sp. NPDC058762 TaxID=3346629 RepID=UPI00368A69CF